MSGFASTKDLADKTISFEELAAGLYGYTAEGDPNSGVVIGDRSVLVVDAQATPKMAQGCHRAHPAGHRQAGTSRYTKPLSCRARSRRVSLRRCGDRCFGCNARPHCGAWSARHG